jgi:malonyl-CoA/methylmalonyl-CoA synthetase
MNSKLELNRTRNADSDQNLYARLSARWTDEQAVAFRCGDASLRYGELRQLASRYAGALIRLGLQPGERISVQVEKSVANAALFLAAQRIGVVYNPLNTAYTAAELEYFLGDAEPKALVAAPERVPSLESAARRNGVKTILTLDSSGSGTMASLAASVADGEDAVAPPVARSVNDPAAILYTSGTTGRSKGAVITHGNLVSNIAALHDLWEFAPEDRLIHALPIFHVHGLFTAMCTALYARCEILWLPAFDLGQIEALLPKATVMMGVPTFYARLLGRPGFNAEMARRMRLFISGSAPLPAGTHRQFAERSGHLILERYGMTECGMIASNPYRGERIPGTVGHALPGVDIRVLKDDGSAAAPGETGMIEVKGPNVCRGYWRKPDKTADEFGPEGYFITGDLGAMSADGRLSITGRARDLIITGGFNVYPKEVEEEIDRIQGVAESAVIGLPHPDLGEAVAAVCARSPERIATENEILAALADRLARFKTPKRVFFLDELPRNAMGKVQKTELRARYGDAFAKG